MLLDRRAIDGVAATTSRLLCAVRAVIVPPLCVGCREPQLSGDAVCARCRAGLEPVGDPRCGACGAPALAPTPVCAECRGRALSFDRAWAAFRYRGAARDLVHALKSKGLLAAAPAMARTLVERAPPDLLDGVVVPVPAHPGRRRRSGFNHAGELARAVARLAGLRAESVLVRRRSRPQAGLERRARLANAPASVLFGARLRPGSTILLVDDVYTTGATLDACASALRGAGSERIVALTFARAVRRRPG